MTAKSILASIIHRKKRNETLDRKAARWFKRNARPSPYSERFDYYGDKQGKDNQYMGD